MVTLSRSTLLTVGILAASAGVIGGVTIARWEARPPQAAVVSVSTRDARHVVVLHLVEGVMRCGPGAPSPSLTDAACRACPSRPLSDPVGWSRCLAWIDAAPCAELARWSESRSCAGALEPR